MNKTKKITNIHDYAKEVDKIIATGKPMVEQFMDVMGLMDVTFIDENQTSNGRLNKHDKSVQDKQTTEKSSAVENNRIKKKRKSSQNDTSDCCGAEVLVASAIPDEGTRYWICSKCGKPCNIMNPCGSQTKRKRDATTGSTAKVHLTKPNNEWEDKLKLVKLVVDEDYDELVTNIGSSLSDRNLKRLIDFITKTLQQQREGLIEEIGELIQIPDIRTMPYFYSGSYDNRDALLQHTGAKFVVDELRQKLQSLKENK